MLAAWFPKDRILKRAVYALLAFFVFALIAGGLKGWDRYQNVGLERNERALAEVVLQYGPASPEAEAALKQFGEANPQSLIALLDPLTDKAIAAWPAELTGKSVREMTLPNGAKLPMPLGRGPGRGGLKMGQGAVTVRLTPIDPFAGDRGERGFGPRVQRGERSGFAKQRVSPSDVTAVPQALLLIASPARGITTLNVIAGVAGALAAVAFVIYWLSIAWWVFADGRRHGGKAFAWGALTLLTNLVGAAVYLVARREQKRCAGCGAAVGRGFNHCPHCGHQLKHTCTQCGHQLQEGWTHCANCGHPRDAEDPQSAE